MDGCNETIYFKIGLWEGDNLGLNKCLGFSPGFNANHYCRFCKIHRNDGKTKCEINGVELRSLTNYEEDLTKTLKETGVAFETKLNDIIDFHAVNNPFVDKMHDFDEGVAKKDLEVILKHFIIKKKYFSLNKLNFITKHFNYGEHEIKNRSPPFKYIYKYKNKKRLKEIKIKSSATETICFIKFLPIMIKHLVPEKDPVWSFLLKVVYLNDLLNLDSYSDVDIEKLRKAITDHHKTFLRLFPNECLTPKCHFLLHYPDIIKKMGPPKKNNCYMNEMKHKLLKRIAKNVNSRRFLPLTLGKKIALLESKQKVQRQKLSLSEYTNLKIVKNRALEEILAEHRRLLAKSSIDEENITIYKKLSFRDQVYKIGNVIASNKSTFFKITSLIKQDNNFLIAVKKLTTIYCKKTTFYRVAGFQSRSLIPFSQLRSFPLTFHNVKGINYVKSKLF